MSQIEKEHLIKGELIERLKPYYAPETHSLLDHILHRLRHPFGHSHHHAIVDVSKFEQKPLEEYSEKQILNRTIFGLKKIKEFNHHFFNEREIEILNPQSMGLISTAMYFSFVGVNATLLTIMYRNKHFSAKSLVLVGGLVATEYLLLKVPNTINEYVQGYYRNDLARKYLSAYGPQFFHDIINPKYDIESIRHLHNKLHDAHHHHH